ncbi:MAG TPA: hypothetical protein VFU46_04820 [Gemmatimonadales bacterium]|nr:hypothetical protein [Gemmatimonadales bacterium]
MTGWDPAATALVELLPRTARGPRRDGIFALWLTTRVAQDLAAEAPAAERSHRRRVAALGQRLSSLAVAPPLRRALAAALAELAAGTSADAARILSQLIAPARETAGPEAADALALAARAARPGRSHG